MSGSMTSLIVSATSFFTSRWSQPLVICKTDSRIFSSFSSSAPKRMNIIWLNTPQTSVRRCEQSAGVELGAEGHQRRLGDHCLIEVEEGRAHVSSLRVERFRAPEDQATKADAHSCAASERVTKITWSSSKKCIDSDGTSG